MSCRNCAYMDLDDRSGYKCYCSYYRQYYDPDSSSCNNYSQRGGGGGMCFLTTACCRYKGLPDDCEELETMRYLRDHYIMRQDYGDKIIKMYYRDAPAIIHAIDDSDDSDAVYEDIYEKVQSIVNLVKAEQFEKATTAYLVMVYELTDRYLVK